MPDWLKSLLTKATGKTLGIFVGLLGTIGIILPPDVLNAWEIGILGVFTAILAFIGDWIMSKLPINLGK